MWCCGAPKTEDSQIDLTDGEKVMVTILGARNLRGLDWAPMRKDECICVLSVRGTEVFRTSPAANLLEPVWRKEAQVSYSTFDLLDFTIWDQDSSGKRRLLGRALLEGSRFEAAGFNGELPLQDSATNDGFIRVKVKTADGTYPQLPDPEVTMVVERDPRFLTAPLGLDLDIQDGVTAWITAIKQGLFRAFNERLPIGQQISAGAFIMRVNGVEGDVEKMIERIKQDPKLELVIRRPVEYCVAVERGMPHDALGLEYPPQPSGTCLVILGMADGLVRDWNKANPDMLVEVKDRIVAVGGQRGRAAELSKGIASGGKLRLTLVRPAYKELFWTYS